MRKLWKRSGGTARAGDFPKRLLKNPSGSVCERGGCNDEARRLSISAVICDGGATKSVRLPRRKMNGWSFSTGSWELRGDSDVPWHFLEHLVNNVVCRHPFGVGFEVCDQTVPKRGVNHGVEIVVADVE